MKRLIVLSLLSILLFTNTASAIEYDTDSVVFPNVNRTEIVEEKVEEPIDIETKKCYTFNEQEKYILLHIGNAEAGNQGAEGVALVMNVVMNRANKWGMTVEQVVFQRGQFTPVSNGSYWREPCADCYKALEMVENGWDESEGALYFCEGWFSWASYVKSYSSHNFFK